MRATRTVLILTGPPGAGKSTVSTLLAARSARSVCIESDWFWTTIISGRIEPWLRTADDQNRVMLRAAAAAAVSTFDGGYDTILEGVIGPWMLPTVLDVFDLATRPVDYVVLRPTLASCLRRATQRDPTPRIAGNPPLAASGPIRDLWHQFADLGPLEGHAVDTTGLTAEATVEHVVRARPQGQFRLVV